MAWCYRHFFFSCNVRGVWIVDTTSMAFIITLSSFKKIFQNYLQRRVVVQLTNKEWSMCLLTTFILCEIWLAAMIHLDRLCIRRLEVCIWCLNLYQTRLLVIMVCVYSAQKRLQLIMQGHNFIGILCAIEAVPYAMKIVIQLAILLMVIRIGELQPCVTM